LASLLTLAAAPALCPRFFLEEQQPVEDRLESLIPAAVKNQGAARAIRTFRQRLDRKVV